MEFVKVLFDNGTVYPGVRQLTWKEYQESAASYREAAHKMLAENGHDHVVYGSRSYKPNGDLDICRLYIPFALDDAEFCKRTKTGDDLVLAIHNHSRPLGMAVTGINN